MREPQKKDTLLVWLNWHSYNRSQNAEITRRHTNGHRRVLQPGIQQENLY